MSLYIYIADPVLRKDMKAHIEKRRWTDSGLDLLCPEIVLDVKDNQYDRLALEIKTGMHFAAVNTNNEPVPYLLMARSSTSLTPLRMSNQIGLADAGYRGELIARVDLLMDVDTYHIPYGRRLFQVVQHNWLPWKAIYLVDSLGELPSPPDARGSGGFGSTGQ
jgi:dUTP pyrophosphatase